MYDDSEVDLGDEVQREEKTLEGKPTLLSRVLANVSSAQRFSYFAHGA